MELTFLFGIIIVILALAFAFSNGFNDAANAVATVISTRALTPVQAIFTASIFSFIGACFLGTAVAKTIGTGIVDSKIVTGTNGAIIIITTVFGATLWNIFCTLLGFPISVSHALIGGFIGSAVFSYGFDVVQWKNVILIFVALLLAPVISLIVSFLVLRITYFLFKSATSEANKLFRILEIISSFNVAVSHGTNDAQKSMGLIVFSLVSLGIYSPDSFSIPKWVVFACSFAFTIGILSGGWNVIKTIGSKIFHMRRIHSFSAMFSSALVLYLASFIGLPLSTTHVISSSVMGAGAAERFKGVRWTTMKNIFIVWVITIPATAIFCGLLYILIFRILKFFGL